MKLSLNRFDYYRNKNQYFSNLLLKPFQEPIESDICREGLTDTGIWTYF